MRDTSGPEPRGLAVEARKTARAASAELQATASTSDSAGLDALAPLRAACRRWHDLDAPCDVARTRVLLAQAYRASHDEDAAALELDAAQATFAHLGAAPGAERAGELRGRPTSPWNTATTEPMTAER